MAAVYRRGKTWWVRFRIDGEHVRQSARTTRKPEAVAYLQKLLREHTRAGPGRCPPEAL